MVTRCRKIFLFIIAAGVFSLPGCNNDLFGLFASNDLGERLTMKNTFHLLSSADRNISLGDTFSFIVLSDTHIENGDAHGLEKLKDIKDIIDDKISFIVFNGDISQNGKREDIATFINIIRSLGVPCYPLPGNHDIYFGNWPAWKELIGSTCYRINGGTATFLMLDSANAYFGAEQLDWLEKEVKSAAGRLFVFTHVNLFAQSLFDIQQFTDTRERARISSLLSNRCDIMFMGHVHAQIIRELAGVRYISTEDYHDHAVYCLVTVSPDGIQWEFKTLP